jgi:serine/threonine protein kinase
MEDINFKFYSLSDFNNVKLLHDKQDYSQINMVIENETNEHKILKTYKLLIENTDKTVTLNDYISKELLINKYLSLNTNITVKLNGIHIDKENKHISLVLDYGDMSLYDYFRKVDYTITDIKVIFYEGIKLLNALHSNGIVHNDIKLENIIFHKKELKLIDFGLSEFFYYSPPFEFINNYLCTEYTKAPDTRKSYETDIYSFALTIVHLIINKYCKCDVKYTYYNCNYCNNNDVCDYCDNYDIKIIAYSTNINVIYDQNYFVDTMGLKGYKLLKLMLHPDINKRINTFDILLDSYFYGFKQDTNNNLNNFNVYPNIKSNIFQKSHKIDLYKGLLKDNMFILNIKYFDYEYNNNLYETKYKHIHMNKIKDKLINTQNDNNFNIYFNIFDKFMNFEYFCYDSIINTLITLKNININKIENIKNDYILYIFMMGLIFNSLFMCQFGTINIEGVIEEMKDIVLEFKIQNKDNTVISGINGLNFDNIFNDDIKFEYKILSIYTTCLEIVLIDSEIYFVTSILSYYIDKIYYETNLIEKNNIEQFKLKCAEDIYYMLKSHIINDTKLDTIIIYTINVNIAKLLNITLEEYNNLNLIPEMKIDLDNLDILFINEI